MDCFSKIPARERSGRFGNFQLRPTHLTTGTSRTVNAPPPPKDMDDSDARSTAAIEADIASKAELARRSVARGLPDDPKTGKGIWSALGIGKDKK